MPIHDVTVTPDSKRLDPGAGLPALGVIHKGEKRTDAMKTNKQSGRDLDYFRIEYFENTPMSVKSWMEHEFGKQPKSFDPVMLLGRTPDEVFPTWRIHKTLNWSRLARKCDGVQQVHYLDPKTQAAKMVERGDPPIPCLGAANPGDHGGCAECKFSGTLRVFFPTILAKSHVRGFFYLHTGSVHDIESISGSLVNLQGLDLDWLAFVLGREDKPIGWRQYEDKQTHEKKMARVTKSLLYLHVSDAVSGAVVKMLASKTGLQALQDGLQAPQIDFAPNAPALMPPSPAAPRPAAKDDVSEGVFTDVDEDDDDDAPESSENKYHCAQIIVQYAKSSDKHTYVLKTDEGRVFTLYTGKLLENVGFPRSEIESWKQQKTLPPLDLKERAFLIFADGDEVVELRRSEMGS